VTERRNNEVFCPLYREALTAASWRSTSSAHAGLLFDKFADAWRYRTDRNGNRTEPPEPEFDKGTEWRRGDANEWINRFRRFCGDANLLVEACARQHQLVESLGGRTLRLTNVSRFVTGFGREHPMENGFAWHHTLGVPYLPGSSLKGMLRAWMRERNAQIVEKSGGIELKETEEVERWFGVQGQAGRLILLDMLPTSPPQLTVDVMTPHYGPYYQDGEVPGDWHSPVPIYFLVVEEGASWQLGLVPAAGVRELTREDLTSLADALIEAIEISGVGAKTAVGYGRFCRADEFSDAYHSALGGGRREQTTGTPPAHPQHRRGEYISVTRIEDPAGRGKVKFQADDGFVGHFAGEEPPSIGIGESVKVWVANVSSQGYTFTLRMPKKKKTRKKGRRR